MSRVPDLPDDLHPTVLLLPWYANGGLNPAERRDVEQHLAGCNACRVELAALSGLRDKVHAAVADAPGPSPRVKAAVMSAVGAARARPGLLDRLARLAGQLLRPKWAPTIAMLLIVCQFGALAWLTQRPATSPAWVPRAVPRTAPRLQVVFSPSASERDVRAALLELGGRIVDGPTAEGGYVIEVAGVPPAELAARLRILRGHAGLVERIDNAGR